MKRVLPLLAIVSLSLPLAAQDDLPPAPYAYTQLEDPAQEAEAVALMESLRCLKCQSQSIADSDAPMAGDMRHQVRTRIAAGQEPEEIRQWLIDRYGDYVSYAPRVTSSTWPLFAIPLLLLLVAGAILWRRIGRKSVGGLDQILDEGDD
ncbi:MAG: cytochrome C biogenesis protein [Altererythrobacter sp. XM-24bin4]|uniref:Cytochrome c-type biogenesis protein n=1 Tax=Altererythrobacter rubellus TaxID=2173831 RepID=A0A9Y2F8Q8_9SPHN|nr:cytochrome c-type biogenesis protein [Altererythrobacter rubellus]PWL26520.1 MAG: cytochrome C biogenesis protein [Altererythrobacter sp. XM-24bin4]WIW95201.1 cytochrome c-type biogenesis protein CcmH [Altererythrobacter rubellus]